MLEPIGLSLQFLKKEVYTGSHHGMRYLLQKDEDTLKACTYPEPYCFEKTADEKKEWKEFEFSADGLTQALEWLSEFTKSLIMIKIRYSCKM